MSSPPFVPKADRIGALDAIRGVAILGILLINIPGMGTAEALAYAPWLPSWSGLDRAIWWLSELLIEGTQRGLLELLFGAGMLLMTRRADPDDERAAVRLYLRRTIILAAVGAVHATLLLWPGEILLIYALAGLLIVPLRHLPPRRLLLIGIGGLALLSAAFGAPDYLERQDLIDRVATAKARMAAGAPLDATDRVALTEWEKVRDDAAFDADAVAREEAQRLGGWRANLDWAVETWREWNGGLMLVYGVAEAWATMLIGAALLKLGWLAGRSPTRAYMLAATAGYAVGVPLNAYEAAQTWSRTLAPHPGWFTYDLARLSVTVGHASLILLLLRTRAGARLLAPFAAVGRVAFTTYLGQTLLCQWLLFPGFALGLWGRFGLAGLWGVAGLIMLAQIAFAMLWLRRFDIGPFEWAWRSAALGSPQPWRRVALAAKV